MQNLVCILLAVQFFVRSAVLQPDIYIAAVLEYSPKTTGSTVKQNFDYNVQEYINYIQQAEFHDVQILVFPEYGLTGWAVSPTVFEELSTEVPDPEQKIAPCQSSTTYAKFLVDLSCTVQKHKIYVVVNLIEWRYDIYKQKKVYHNTNIALDRNGVIIARYRKINLVDEAHYEPGPHAVSVFPTDFGVTFGMFICFDILYKTPALDVLADPSVTDIVYSAAWFSELPFFHANSIQHGYAKANAVNLLAAGMNDPAETNGGSGIYLSDGRISEMYISGEKKSQLIIQHVPKLRSRTYTSYFCQGSSGSPTQNYHLGIGSTLPSTNLFYTTNSDLSLYTFQSLNLNQRVISERICSGDSDFCCNFDIIVNQHSSVHPNYIYKLVAFYGVRKISQTRTIGLRNCGLIACLDETDESCGGRNFHASVGVSFERISINGTFNPKDSQYRPSTLKSDLTPATDYMFCTQTRYDDEMEVNVITTKRHDSLLAFGILGRVFINDDLIPGSINGTKMCVPSVPIVFIICILIFLSQ